MKITIQLETGNEAMKDGQDVGRLLRNVAADFELWGNLATLKGASGHEETLRDYNGNTVGRVTVR